MNNYERIKNMDSYELAYFITNLYRDSDGDSQCFNKCKEYNVTCGARCRKNLQEWLEEEICN